MLNFVILSTVFLLLLILYLVRFSKQRPKNFPPGPCRLPIWGSYWLLLKENYNLVYLSLEKLGKRYKTDILGFYLGDFPTVVTLSYALSKEALAREEFLGRPDTVLVRARSRGEPKGVVFTEGPFWKEHKRFSLRHMRDHGFGRRSETLENFVLDEVQNLICFLSSEPKKEDFNICKKMGHVLIPDFLYGTLTNSTMLPLTSTYIDKQKIKENSKAILRFVKSIDAIGGAITMTPWLRFFAPDHFGYTTALEDNGFLLDFLKKIVDEHIETFSDDHHRDFLDDYISENNRHGFELDYNQLLLVLLDYMFPSVAALAQSMSFYFAHVINHPTVQIKVQEEIDRVVGRSRLPNLDDRKSMPYLEATIRESLRHIPITPIGLPKKCIEDTTLSGYFIPKNTLIFANVWTAHRDESVWENGNEFKPERFLDEDGNLRKRSPDLGFGLGKRACAGETHSRQIMFLILSGILQNFTVKSASGKPVDIENLTFGITLSLKETWILAIPR